MTTLAATEIKITAAQAILLALSTRSGMVRDSLYDRTVKGRKPFMSKPDDEDGVRAFGFTVATVRRALKKLADDGAVWTSGKRSNGMVWGGGRDRVITAWHHASRFEPYNALRGRLGNNGVHGAPHYGWRQQVRRLTNGETVARLNTVRAAIAVSAAPAFVEARALSHALWLNAVRADAEAEAGYVDR